MRDTRIDSIRAICSMLVIIAHVSAPEWINNFRSFDVVALVLVSGMSLFYGSQITYSSMILKRIKKLLLPTVLMMIIVFGGSFFTCYVLKIKQLYSKSQIFRSFLLLNDGSMGYVWIVRVYLVIALLTPLIKKGVQRINSIVAFIICILLISIITFALRISLSSLSESLFRIILFDWGYSSIVYSLVAFIGLWVIKNIKNLNLILLLVSLLFLCYSILLSINSQEIVFTPNNYKFPPRFYYCLYGVLIGLLLYRCLPQNDNPLIRWISIHSFSIYLWHIIVLHAYGVMVMIPGLSFLDSQWFLKFITVLSLSLAMTFSIDSLKKVYINAKKKTVA